MTIVPEIPAALSVRTLAGGACEPATARDGTALAAVEMAAHLEFTVDLELRVVAPAAGLLAHRLGARGERYAGPLRRIAEDELDHAFGAVRLLGLFGPRPAYECPGVDDALAALRPYGLSARDALVALFVVSESVVSTYLGGARTLAGDDIGLCYLRDHARDELGHGRFVARLVAGLLADPALLAAAVGDDDPVRLATALGAATRGYADASLAFLLDEGAAHGVGPEPWPAAAAYAELLAAGVRPVLGDAAALREAFDAALSGAGG